MEKTVQERPAIDLMGVWRHDGAYSLQLKPAADTSLIPSEVEQDRTGVFHVEDGIVSSNHHGIQFWLGQPMRGGKPFFFSRAVILAIRDGKGRELWPRPDFNSR